MSRSLSGRNSMNLTGLRKKVSTSPSCVTFCPNSCSAHSIQRFAPARTTLPPTPFLHTLTYSPTLSHTHSQEATSLCHPPLPPSEPKTSPTEAHRKLRDEMLKLHGNIRESGLVQNDSTVLPGPPSHELSGLTTMCSVSAEDTERPTSWVLMRSRGRRGGRGEPLFSLAYPPGLIWGGRTTA